MLSFTEVDLGLPGVESGSVAWGDYDDDGDLDLLLTGSDGSQALTRILRNDGGTFSELSTSLPQLSEGCADWFDYDNDGDLDLFVTGYSAEASAIFRLYRNENGNFSRDNIIVAPAILNGAVDYGDAYGDGDQDLLLTAAKGIRVYSNNRDDGFALVFSGDFDLDHSSASWVDFDDDGDLDIFVAGHSYDHNVALLYRNDGNWTFSQVSTGLPAVSRSSMAWADYDGDGDQDLLLTGWTGTEAISRVYRNDASGWTELDAGLPGVVDGSVAWGDCDNDGDLDILLTGDTGSEFIARVYLNDNGVFTDLDAGLSGVHDAAVAWADFDEDGDLDILLTGSTNAGPITRVYRNDGSVANTLPSSPPNPGEDVNGIGATLSWDASSDLETPTAALTYNLRVGTTPGGSELSTAMANSDTGYRQVLGLGNLLRKHSRKLLLPVGTYYWGVQSVDSALKGSSFTEERSFVVDGVVGRTNGLPVQSAGLAEWGDYDNDGDLDVLYGGYLAPTVYRNDSGHFTRVSGETSPSSSSILNWVDYDNDGDLDVFMYSGTRYRLCRNDGNTFTLVNLELGIPLAGGSAWGDYDNDGDQDLVLTAKYADQEFTALFKNDGGEFHEIPTPFAEVYGGGVSWADYDNDGDLDLLLTGWLDSSTSIIRLYRNDGGSFSEVDAGLPTGNSLLGAWVDCDNDGDLDLFLSGSFEGTTPGWRIGRIYRNDGGVFSTLAVQLSTVGTLVSWGDFDNDGDPDLLSGGGAFRIYRNDGGAFHDIVAWDPGQSGGSASWGDYNNDGVLDILLVGSSTAPLYEYPKAEPNQPPLTPANFQISRNGRFVTFSWDPSSDAETPTAALTYNLRVGTNPGGDEISPAMADSLSGYRRVVHAGNVSERTSWTLKLPYGKYYCSVQAIDGAYAGSAFSQEEFLSESGFSDQMVGLPPVTNGAGAWGDYDSDGNLDLLLTGSSTSGAISKLYRSYFGDISEVSVSLPGVERGSVDWGDYDNDGDLDILLTGQSSLGPISRVYRNDGGTFQDIAADLAGVSSSSASWGDYDNDGDLDILLSGSTSSGATTRIYRNDGGIFNDAGAGLPGVFNGSAAWGDYDRDGDLDLVLTGSTGLITLARIYRNDAGNFMDAAAGLPSVQGSSVAWGDYDNDGDLDLLLSGLMGSNLITRVFRNDGGHFYDIAANLPGMTLGMVAWGDRDDDGDLDILLSGYSSLGPITRVYRNEDGAFAVADTTLPGLSGSTVAWGDYDRDGDLDLLLTGADPMLGPTARVYSNEGIAANVPPLAPTALEYEQTSGSSIRFSWNRSTDTETPQAGLSYNLRIGTTPTGNQVLAGMAREDTGIRTVPRVGNAQQNTSWTLNSKLAPGVYYWSVQAVDASFASSPFAAAKSFRITGFEGVDEGIPGLGLSATAWCDYDGDGDLDVLVTGESSSGLVTRIYDNDSGDLTPSLVQLPGVDDGGVAWGDYDGDGVPDLLLAGTTGSDRITRVYRRENGGYVDIHAGMEGVSPGAVAWADYDNDGDLDALVAGDTGTDLITRIYRNGDGIFSDAQAGLPGLRTRSVAWADYDRDGDLDLLVCGNTAVGSITTLFRNDQGAFSETEIGLPGVIDGAVSWGDYDADGYPDLALAGWTSSGRITRIYRNVGGSFQEVPTNLPGVDFASLAWADYDNDGDSDLLLAGASSEGGLITRVYRNDAGTFRDAYFYIPGVYNGSAIWGDSDNDGRLDILLTGLNENGRIARIYRNVGVAANLPPSGPTGLSAVRNGSSTTFSWRSAWDSQTRTTGLTYDLRVGVLSGGNEISSSPAEFPSGYRRLVHIGNVGARTSWTLRNVPYQSPIYWTVQAVDGAYAGSQFLYEREYDGFEAPLVASGSLGATASELKWGDYDNDGDLDLLGTFEVNKIARNTEGSFDLVDIGLPYFSGREEWGDYDNDGDLDVALLGETAYPDWNVGVPLTRVYRNDQGTFSDLAAGLIQLSSGSIAWGDFDSDGDLDLIVAGQSDTECCTRLYRNDSGVFTETESGLPDLCAEVLNWVDYDNDGKLDLFVLGNIPDVGDVCRIYSRGRYGDFFDSGVRLPAVVHGDASWGDFEADGDFDLLLMGQTPEGDSQTQIFRNVGGDFEKVNVALPGSPYGSCSWGDLDNDGDMDILLAGNSLARIFRNENGAFFSSPLAPGNLPYALGAWGDYDGDGDLDFVFTGKQSTSYGSYYAYKLYRCDGPRIASPPSAPTHLTAVQNGRKVTLLWDPATDEQTPQAGLSYNLRIGTTPGGGEIFSGMADYLTGYRRQIAFGAVNGGVGSGGKGSWTLHGVEPQTRIFWSVQAIDGSYVGSAFSVQDSIQTVVTAVSDPLPSFSNALEQNYPNPFNPTTEIQFSLAARGKTRLIIYNTAGRCVRTLANEVLDAGQYRMRWNGRSDSGARVASGIYFYRLQTSGFTMVKRMLLLK